jgi:hypothetical protein
MTALSVADVSAYVRSLTPMAASSRAGQLYFLREYLRFASTVPIPSWERCSR